MHFLLGLLIAHLGRRLKNCARENEQRKLIDRLINTRDSRATVHLVPFLSAENESIVRSVVYGLGSLPPDLVAVPALAAALQHPRWFVRREVADLLAKMDWTPPDAATSLRFNIARGKYEEALRTGAAAYSQLFADYTEGAPQYPIREAIVRFGGVNAIPHLKPFCQHPDSELRQQGLAILQEIGHPAAVPMLVSAMKDPDPGVRHIALDGIGKLALQAELPAVRSALKDTDVQIRSRALLLLAEAKDTAWIPTVAELLLSHEGQAVVEAIRAVSTPENLPDLMGKHMTERVIAQIATALERRVHGATDYREASDAIEWAKTRLELFPDDLAEVRPWIQVCRRDATQLPGGDSGNVVRSLLVALHFFPREAATLLNQYHPNWRDNPGVRHLADKLATVKCEEPNLWGDRRWALAMVGDSRAVGLSLAALQASWHYEPYGKPGFWSYYQSAVEEIETLLTFLLDHNPGGVLEVDLRKVIALPDDLPYSDVDTGWDNYGDKYEKPHCIKLLKQKAADELSRRGRQSTHD